jgi:hypothetical protein
MVVRLRIPDVGPDLDYRVHTDARRRRHTDFDSYDESDEVYYEFKTRHQNQTTEGLDPGDTDQWVAWMRRSEIFSQANRQRQTLIGCGFHRAKLYWVFDTPLVARMVGEYIAPWPVDEVWYEKWDRRDRKRAPR